MERIGKVSECVAYCILLSVCQNDSSLQQRVTDLIDKYDATLKTQTTATTDADQTPAPAPIEEGGASAGIKRKAIHIDDMMECIDCSEMFFPITRRGRSICRFHNGNLTPDYDSDFWADHDEDVDTEQHRIDYPDGFIWDCCDRVNDNTTRGCRKRNHHVSLEAVHKRSRRTRMASLASRAGIPIIDVSSDEDNGNESSDISEDHSSEESSREESLSEEEIESEDTTSKEEVDSTEESSRDEESPSSGIDVAGQGDEKGREGSSNYEAAASGPG